MKAALKQLFDWQTNPRYDPEQKEAKLILKLIGKEKDCILIEGIYGCSKLAFQLEHKVEWVTGISSNTELIHFLQQKKFDGCFCHGKLEQIEFDPNYLSIVLLPWTALHYNKHQQKIIQHIHHGLYKKGKLIIEEGDETSEYVKILNELAPKKKQRMKSARDKLKKTLKKYFNVQEKKLTTFYHFKSKNEFKNYFKNELTFHEKRKWTSKMEEKLNSLLSRRKSLKVQEKSVFFVCTK